MTANKTALVTGAGSGVGRATALLLAEAGYDIALVGRTKSKLEDTIQLAADRGIDQVVMTPYAMDLTDAAAVRDLAGAVLSDLGFLNAVANIAGSAPLQPIKDITPDIWQSCIDSNLAYIVHLTAALWPAFHEQKAGVIVNVSSMASIDPFPGFSIYAAAKVGLNMFTRCIAEEGKRIGLQAVAIAPGAIETPMLRENFNEKMLPKDKCLSPEQVAQVIRDCITGARTFKSGETIQLPSP